MTLNPKKCDLFSTEITLLGHKVNAEGIEPLTEKLDIIHKWPRLKNRKEVRSFMGTCNYYRRFVPNFAHVSAPLSRLTSEKVSWRWGETEELAFNQLKEHLTSSSILTQFIPGRATILDTDASDRAIGAVLSQIDENDKERVVAYFSRCLNAPEKNYCTTKKELLAIVEALRYWRHYTIGAPIKVRTDHSSLTWIRNFKSPQGQLARWLERLAEFNIDLEYRKGVESGNADGLSRRSCDPDCKYCLRRENEDNLRVNVLMAADDQVNWVLEQGGDAILKDIHQWLIAECKPPWEEISALSPFIKSFWRDFELLQIKKRFIGK